MTELPNIYMWAEEALAEWCDSAPLSDLARLEDEMSRHSDASGEYRRDIFTQILRQRNAARTGR